MAHTTGGGGGGGGLKGLSDVDRMIATHVGVHNIVRTRRAQCNCKIILLREDNRPRNVWHAP